LLEINIKNNYNSFTMPESTEVSVSEKGAVYSPEQTHKKWKEKLQDAGITLAFFASSVGNAVTAASSIGRASSTREHMQALQEMARQIGGALNSETLHYLATSAKSNEQFAIIPAIASLAFFGVGTYRVIKEKHIEINK
jgi:hypothetical protein